MQANSRHLFWKHVYIARLKHFFITFSQTEVTFAELKQTFTFILCAVTGSIDTFAVIQIMFCRWASYANRHIGTLGVEQWLIQPEFRSCSVYKKVVTRYCYAKRICPYSVPKYSRNVQHVTCTTAHRTRSCTFRPLSSFNMLPNWAASWSCIFIASHNMLSRSEFLIMYNHHLTTEPHIDYIFAELAFQIRNFLCINCLENFQWLSCWLRMHQIFLINRQKTIITVIRVE